MRQTRRSTLEPPSLPSFPGYGAGHESWYLTAFGKDNDHLTASLLSRCYSGIFIFIILVLFFEEAQNNLLSILIFSPHPPCPICPLKSLFYLIRQRQSQKAEHLLLLLLLYFFFFLPWVAFFRTRLPEIGMCWGADEDDSQPPPGEYWRGGEGVESQRQWLRQRLRLRQRQSHP